MLNTEYGFQSQRVLPWNPGLATFWLSRFGQASPASSVKWNHIAPTYLADLRGQN